MNPLRLSVLLCTQGTYPFASGGVSTWCDLLCKEMSAVDFTIYALTGIPQTESLYDLPSNVGQILSVPMWGMQEPAEFIQTQMSFFDIRKKKTCNKQRRNRTRICTELSNSRATGAGSRA